MNDGKRVDKRAACIASLMFLGDQVVVFSHENGFVPTSKQGLNVLVEKPVDHPTPHTWKKSMRSLPLDPWGRQFSLVSPAPSPRGFEIRSMGPLEGDPADDIIR